MSTLTDARLRKFEELMFSPSGGGTPDRASGDSCTSEESPATAPETATTESAVGGTPTPDRASGDSCTER